MQHFGHSRILTGAVVLAGLLFCLVITLLTGSLGLPAIAAKGHHRHTPPSPPVISPPPPTTSLTIQFTCAQATDYLSGSVCVHTQAGAALTITITYCSGYKAVSSSLQGVAYADTSGNYTWTWTPETVCRGPATADVTAQLAGQTVTQSDPFTVQ
jgi:hypothetical protein